MKTRIFPVLLLAALLCGLLSPVPVAQAMPAAALAAPESFLNADGTLNLDGSFSGSLNLTGWNVQIDPRRGPVFAPAQDSGLTTGTLSSTGSALYQRDQALQTDIAAGEWAALGSGGSPLNGNVTAIAVSGIEVYIGGQFIDPDSQGQAANYIVKWNGTSWSALDPNTYFAGSVSVITVSGSDVYVGGNFNHIYTQTGYISGAGYVAKWDGTQWSSLGNDGSGGSSLADVNSYANVSAIAVSGSDV
jgi:hypothetical protein